MSRLTAEEWANARIRWETEPGLTAAQLSRDIGVSAQMIGRKAKQDNWTRPRFPESLAESSLIKRTQGSEIGKRSEETLTQFLSVLALSGDKKLACAAVGITEQTVANWCNEDPQLLVEMKTARAHKLAGHIAKIAESKDWKAHLKLLQVAPETRDQYADRQKQDGPTIVLNIHRDEVVIESGAPDKSPDNATFELSHNEKHRDDESLLEETIQPSSKKREPRKQKSWQGDNLTEKKALSEQRALERRVMGHD